MEESSEFISSIKVRDLISAYENKVETSRVEWSRPRAKSLGNILAKNVVVRTVNFNSLNDIEAALVKLEADLNYYQVYNKEKHVSFQEQLFNILTSSINLESDSADGPARKKKLITKTQTLVSFLNHKLPSNAASVTKSQQRYSTYAEYMEKRTTAPTIAAAEAKPDVTTYVQSSESHSEVEPIEVVVSVQKLKENFQPRQTVDDTAIPSERTEIHTTNLRRGQSMYIRKSPEATVIQKEKIAPVTIVSAVKTQQTVSTHKVVKAQNSVTTDQTVKKQLVTNQALKTQPTNADNLIKSQQTESTADVTDGPQNQSQVVVEAEQEAEQAVLVSVSKLRNMFEIKNKEEAQGLQNILSPQKDFQYEVSIPYTEGNLGAYRLYRANSGNYMNYSGLLKNAHISRTQSANNHDYKTYAAYKKEHNGKPRNDSDVSDTTTESDESINSVKEVNVDYSTALYDRSNNNVETNTTTAGSVEVAQYQTAQITESNSSQSSVANSSRVAEVQNVNYATAVSSHTGEMRSSRLVATEDRQYQSSKTVHLNQQTSTTEVSTINGVKEVDAELSNAVLGPVGHVQISTTTVSKQEVKLPAAKDPVTNITTESHTLETHTISTPAGPKEVEVKYITGSTGSIGAVQTSTTTVSEQEVKSTAAHVPVANITTQSHTLETHINPTTGGAKEVEVQHSTASTGPVENVQTSTTTIVSEVKLPAANVTATDVTNQKHIVETHTISTRVGPEEAEVKHSTVSTASVGHVQTSTTTVEKQEVNSHPISTIDGTKEVEVNYSTASTGPVQNGNDTLHSLEYKVSREDVMSMTAIPIDPEDLRTAEEEFEKLVEMNVK